MLLWLEFHKIVRTKCIRTGTPSLDPEHGLDFFLRLSRNIQCQNWKTKIKNGNEKQNYC